MAPVLSQPTLCRPQRTITLHMDVSGAGNVSVRRPVGARPSSAKIRPVSNGNQRTPHQSLQVRWAQRLEDVVVWRQHNGQWPATNAVADRERALGRWIATQRSRAVRNELPNLRRYMLDEQIPGWNAIDRSDDTQWVRNRDDIIRWLETHDGTFPTVGVLATWVNHQRAAWRNGKLLPRRRRN